MKNFTSLSGDLVIDGSGWGNQVHIHQTELKSQLNSIISNTRQRELEKMQTLTTKATYDTIEEIVNPPIYELKNTFWEEIRTPYV
jgi:hypothetical protein